MRAAALIKDATHIYIMCIHACRYIRRKRGVSLWKLGNDFPRSYYRLPLFRNSVLGCWSFTRHARIIIPNNATSVSFSHIRWYVRVSRLRKVTAGTDTLTLSAVTQIAIGENMACLLCKRDAICVLQVGNRAHFFFFKP